MKTEGVLSTSFAVTAIRKLPLTLAVLAWATCSAPAAVIEAWVQRYHGPANGHDEARAVTVDSSGNVVVTGKSWNGTNVDIYTAKYAATNGALMWERRYNGVSGGSDFPAAIAVDGRDDVVVAGSASGFSYTAKYAAHDGVLIWEQLQAGPGNPGSRARALAIDADNNVSSPANLIPRMGLPITVQRSTPAEIVRWCGSDATTGRPVATTMPLRWVWIPKATFS
jgi:hypothetical protein